MSGRADYAPGKHRNKNSRLAAALRANLKRRKTQARERAAEPDEAKDQAMADVTHADNSGRQAKGPPGRQD